MKNFTIHEFDNILEIIDFVGIDNRFQLFRGQNNTNWKLVPTIARNFLDIKPENNWFEIESFLLDDFKRFSLPYIEQEPISKLDWLSLGQHYKLPTRLLDWTTNPLKALFFAVFENFNEDGALFALNVNWIIENTSNLLLLDKLKNRKSLAAFFPKLIDKRIIAQEAAFTILSFPEGNEVFRALEDSDYFNEETHNLLVKVVIPKSAKTNILVHLNKLGINNRTLFPDFEGLSRHLAWDHKLI